MKSGEGLSGVRFWNSPNHALTLLGLFGLSGERFGLLGGSQFEGARASG